MTHMNTRVFPCWLAVGHTFNSFHFSIRAAAYCDELICVNVIDVIEFVVVCVCLVYAPSALCVW